MGYYFTSGSDAFMPGSGSRADVNQVLYADPQPNQSFVAALSSADRTTLVDKAIGTMVFDTGDNQLYIWNGASWVDISTP